MTATTLAQLEQPRCQPHRKEAEQQKPLRHYAIVLAAGDGMRLRQVTSDPVLGAVPKQFCSLRGGRSLLGCAIARAQSVVPIEHTLAVVAAQHARYFRREVAVLPPANVLVQPANRGTATGLLLPLLTIAMRDPRASVLILPSDHHVDDEALLAVSMQRALHVVEQEPRVTVLLGMTPDAADPDYGWIVPAEEEDDGTHQVGAFVEKPLAAEAQRLLQLGGLWNTFLMAGSICGISALFQRWLPTHWRLLTRAITDSDEELAACYEGLPAADFSRHVLQQAWADLRTLRVPECGWSDLGTPERARSCVRAHATMPQMALEEPFVPAVLDLQSALARLENPRHSNRKPA